MVKFINMNIEQIYTGCLAQGAYYITSDGEAAIIDPLREVQPYLDRLKKDNVKLKYIFRNTFSCRFCFGTCRFVKKQAHQLFTGQRLNLLLKQ
jgi:hypothetical protein